MYDTEKYALTVEAIYLLIVLLITSITVRTAGPEIGGWTFLGGIFPLVVGIIYAACIHSPSDLINKRE